MEQNHIQEITLTGLLIGLVAVATMMITIPVPSTEGFIHLGDSMIFLAALLFGKRAGALAGGLGSALADVLLGYSHWAVPTLLIKGLMGFLAGSLADQSSSWVLGFRNILALVAGSLWMVFGYFVAGGLMQGSFLVSLTSVPSNLVQAFGGALLFLPLGMALKRGKLVERLISR